MSAVLDAGALVGIDRRDPKVGALLRAAQQLGIPVRTSSAAVAQVWRDGRSQANLARVLRGVEVVALDDAGGRRVGELLRVCGTANVVDAHVAMLVAPGGQVVTSDKRDLRKLLQARNVRATVIEV